MQAQKVDGKAFGQRSTHPHAFTAANALPVDIKKFYVCNDKAARSVARASLFVAPMVDTVTLRSCEGMEFAISEDVVRFSGILTVLLDRNSPFQEAISRVVDLPIKAAALKRVVAYLEYRHKYSKSEGPIPDFEVGEEESLDLLSVSFYLKI